MFRYVIHDRFDHVRRTWRARRGDIVRDGRSSRAFVTTGAVVHILAKRTVSLQIRDGSYDRLATPMRKILIRDIAHQADFHMKGVVRAQEIIDGKALAIARVMDLEPMPLKGLTTPVS